MPLMRFSAVVSWVIFLSSYRLMMMLIFCRVDVGTLFLFLSLMEFKMLILFDIFLHHILPNNKVISLNRLLKPKNIIRI